MKRNRLNTLFLLLFFFFAVSLTGCSSELITTGNDSVAETNADADKKAEDIEIDTTAQAEAVKSGMEGELTVHFLDVGQGNSVLVVQDGKYMLIDGGDRDYSSFVVSYLKQLGVEKLDYVVASHYDADHLNGIVGVLNVFPCDLVIGPDYEGDTKVYQSFRDVVESKEIKFEVPEWNGKYQFAGSEFQIVSPVSYDYTDGNELSIGVKLKYQDNSFLICGDIGNDMEQDMLLQGADLKSNVFLANHHGSKYSNGEEFLNAVSPEYVVISCGIENKYEHPAASLLLNVQKLNASLYRTDLQGTLLAVSDGTNIRFNTSPSMDYRSGAELKKEDKTSAGTQEQPQEKAADLESFEMQMDEAQTMLEESDTDVKDSVTNEFVLNTNTKKFHLSDCSSAKDIKDENKEISGKTKDELIAEGYGPCKRCNP